MAEIKIKKKQPIWPWLLLLAGILAGLYYFFVYDENDAIVDKKELVTEDTTAMPTVADEKVAEYNQFIADNSEMDLDHEFSNNALLKLIAATEAVANSVNVDINADLDTARADADYITKDPMEGNHANKIKSAGEIIVQALTKVQTQKFENLSTELSDVKSSVNKIENETSTLEQKAAVKDFFKRAGELLTNMNQQ